MTGYRPAIGKSTLDNLHKESTAESLGVARWTCTKPQHCHIHPLLSRGCSLRPPAQTTVGMPAACRDAASVQNDTPLRSHGRFSAPVAAWRAASTIVVPTGVSTANAPTHDARQPGMRDPLDEAARLSPLARLRPTRLSRPAAYDAQQTRRSDPDSSTSLFRRGSKRHGPTAHQQWVAGPKTQLLSQSFQLQQPRPS